jgi:hypothetical protein
MKSIKHNIFDMYPTNKRCPSNEEEDHKNFPSTTQVLCRNSFLCILKMSQKVESVRNPFALTASPD